MGQRSMLNKNNRVILNNEKQLNKNNNNNYNNYNNNSPVYDFIYPYNFVSIGKKCTRGVFQKGNLTGYIDVSLTPKTDLIIPGENKAKGFEFYNYNNKYAIPGSQVRGTIRTIYEIITNSCISQIEDSILSNRYGVEQAKDWIPKVLKYENSCWRLYDIEDIKSIYISGKNYKCECGYVYDETKESNSFKSKKFICPKCKKTIKKNYEKRKYKNSSDVKKDLVKICENKNNYKYHSDIIKNAIKIMQKYSLSIYSSNEYIFRIGEKTIENTYSLKYGKISKSFECATSEMIERFIENCNIFVNNAKEKALAAGVLYNKFNLYEDCLYGIENKTPIFVYYNEATHLMSPSQVGRRLYMNNLENFYRGYEPCSKELCPSCALFGTVSESDKTSLKSRIRFTDFVLDNNDNLNKKDVKLISLGAHIDNANFYSTDLWDNPASRIRGRKFYWHHQIKNNSTSKNANANVEESFEALCFDEYNSKSFNGKIYFEDLTENELKDLIFSIELGDDYHMHKIGHGKPFGYGSVNAKCNNVYLRKIYFDKNEIKNVYLRKIDFDKNEIKNELYVYKNPTWDDYRGITAYDELEKITNFKIFPDNENIEFEYPAYNSKEFKYKENRLNNIMDVVSGKYFTKIYKQKSLNNNKRRY